MNFKRFAVGFAIFVLTVVFIVFVNKAINPKPKQEDCYRQPMPLMMEDQVGGNATSVRKIAPSYPGQYQNCYEQYQRQLKTYKERSFMVVAIMSVLAIVAGVLVRSVSAVSGGLIAGGLVTLLYIFIASFTEIGKPYRAIISGVVLAFLIWFAYARLGDHEENKPEKVTSAPPNNSPSKMPEDDLDIV